jgi:urea transport system permease protein
MGVINMAHGELMMLGAYTTYVVQLLMPQHIGASILVALPAAFVVSGLVGVGIERGIVRFLYGRPLETLLATFGVSLILQQAVRDIFSANNRPVETPSWLAGTWQINEVLAITYNRLYIIVFTLGLFLLLLTVLKRTRLGLEVRAVSQNRAMAKAMGVRTEWVDALTFGLGSGIAGVAGVALSQQCRPESRTELHRRCLHGGGVRRSRQSLGHRTRRQCPRHRQQGVGAVLGRGTRENIRAGVPHPIHTTSAAGTIPAKR